MGARAMRLLPFVRGRWRLHSYFDKVVPRVGQRSATVFGAHMELDLQQEIQRSIYMGVFEPEETAILRKALRPGMTFVDVGANCGYFTALASALVGEEGRVVSFEPAQAFQTLKILATNNNWTHVTVRNVALGATRGAITLYTPSDISLGHNSSIVRYLDDMTEQTVFVSTLDQEVQGPIDLMKIDVEGCELDVLAGASGAVAEGRLKAVLCEFNPELQQKAGHSINQLYEWFTDHGFSDGIGSVPNGFGTRLMRFRGSQK